MIVAAFVQPPVLAAEQVTARFLREIFVQQRRTWVKPQRAPAVKPGRAYIKTDALHENRRAPDVPYNEIQKVLMPMLTATMITTINNRRTSIPNANANGEL